MASWLRKDAGGFWGELNQDGKVDDPRAKRIKASILRGMEQELEKEPVVPLENLKKQEHSEESI